MSRRKEIMIALGTLGCAVAIGFVMQSTETAHQIYGAERGTQQPQPAASPAQAGDAVLEVQAITLTAAELESNVERPAVDPQITKVSAPQTALPAPQAVPELPARSCEVTANARPVAAAMVNLTLAAPCFPNERVTVHHNGMIFTQTTSAEGALDIVVPALTRDAMFVMAFANGEGGIAQTTVEDLHEYDRVVLQWKGSAGFELHAREFGADYGDEGHVWTGAARDISYAAAGQGGFIARQGDEAAADPLLAEVYTFPTSVVQQSGTVDLSVETEVSMANCGAEIEAQVMQMHGSAELVTRDLTLAVPDCDAVGSFLVLNNLLEDLKVAGK
ncbi:MAG: hypothetical protein ACSHWZ_11655 [Sulfitobacter sp.]